MQSLAVIENLRIAINEGRGPFSTYTEEALQDLDDEAAYLRSRIQSLE